VLARCFCGLGTGQGLQAGFRRVDRPKQ
jgi:hypothetical protein